MHEDYRIVLAEPSHLTRLQAIEYAAGQLFKGWGFPDELIEHEMPLSVLQEGLSQQLLWVTLSATEVPVGFALLERDGDFLHLEELDVHPDHGRRGIGSALVNKVCEWGREQGFKRMTLTTFHHIPWNRPFYEKLNFRVVPEHLLSAELKDRMEREAGKGMEPGLRVAMERWL
jgi:GNAT superfamily N-acetyltransferase